jgi:hypothetical protein
MVRDSIAEDEDMAFSSENQQWIRDEIDRAIRIAVNPLSRTKRLLRGLKDWGLTALIWAVPLALLGGCIALGTRLVSDIKEGATFRTHTEDKIAGIEKSLSGVERSLLELRGRAVIANPPNVENQAAAKNILADAKRGSINLPLDIVEKGGEKFIQAAEHDPKAWDTALDFVSYRTELNPNGPPSGFGPLPKGKVWSYGTNGVGFIPGKPIPRLSYSRNFGVPADKAARLDLIGKDANAGIPVGPMFLVMQGGAYSLDNHEIRSVFFDHVEVHYSGAPLILENAVFIGCTFVMDNVANGRLLGIRLLSSNSVTFRAES